MSKTTTAQRKAYLNQYKTALRQIELAGVAITVMEGMNTKEAIMAIRALKRGQGLQVRILDEAAEKLGAPYGL
jgi:hypothetical protein